MQSVAQQAQPEILQQRRYRMIRERTTRGMLLYNAECERIHVLYGDTWAVPSHQGGFWRVNLDDETCGCQDFRYYCDEHDIACKHVICAAIARAKRHTTQDHPHACTDGWVYLGYTEDEGNEQIEALPCRRCAEDAR